MRRYRKLSMGARGTTQLRMGAATSARSSSLRWAWAALLMGTLASLWLILAMTLLCPLLPLFLILALAGLDALLWPAIR